jgi:hypothetical protein
MNFKLSESKLLKRVGLFKYRIGYIFILCLPFLSLLFCFQVHTHVKKTTIVLRDAEKKVEKILTLLKGEKEFVERYKFVKGNYLDNSFKDFQPLKKEKKVAKKIQSFRPNFSYILSQFSTSKENEMFSFILNKEKKNSIYEEKEFVLKDLVHVASYDILDIIQKIEGQNHQAIKDHEKPYLKINQFSLKRDESFLNSYLLNLSVIERRGFEKT